MIWQRRCWGRGTPSPTAASRWSGCGAPFCPPGTPRSRETPTASRLRKPCAHSCAGNKKFIFNLQEGLAPPAPPLHFIGTCAGKAGCAPINPRIIYPEDTRHTARSNEWGVQRDCVPLQKRKIKGGRFSPPPRLSLLQLPLPATAGRLICGGGANGRMPSAL